MKKPGSLLFALLLVFGTALTGFSAHAASPSFTVSATNVTMPSTGNGSIPFTLTSMNGYAGQVFVQCGNVNATPGARIPTCGGGPVFAYTLKAGGSVSNALDLAPYGSVLPASVTTGALLFVWSRRRRLSMRLLGLFFIFAASAAALGGLAGCGGNTSGMTPGTYAYTITATDIKTSAAVSTTASVTVR